MSCSPTCGYSRAQLTRLVARWSGNRLAATPLVKRYVAPRNPFKRKYTAEDVALPVQTDRANGQACGAAVAHLFKRGLLVYGDTRHERLGVWAAEQFGWVVWGRL